MLCLGLLPKELETTKPLISCKKLFSFAKGNNGVTVTVTSTGGVYKYEVDNWQIWYTIIPPLVLKGLTFEQPDFWQSPEMVFRGMSFEYIDRKNGVSPLFFGQD